MKQFLLFAFAISLLLQSGCKKDGPAAEEAVVNLYVFSEYIPKDVLDDFSKESGVKVNVANFDNNEELLAKLAAGSSEFDVISPSDYVIRRLVTKGLIQKLDRGKLTNFGNLDPAFLDRSFDKGNEYSIPLFWGTTGLAYNKKKITEPIDSWSAAFDPKYKGQVLMLKDGRELLAAAFRSMGKNVNERDPAAIDQAIALLRKQKEIVKIYDSQAFQEKLAAGDVLIAQGFNGQFAKVIADKPDELAYVIPKEGGTLWIDNYAIPTKSKHVGHAHALLNFLQRPDIAARTANYAAYGSPNQAARPQIDKKWLDNPIIYPPADILKRCTAIEDLGESNKLVDGLMAEIKS